MGEHSADYRLFELYLSLSFLSPIFFLIFSLCTCATFHVPTFFRCVACGGGGTLEMHAQNGRTALFYAAIKGHAECVRLLLDAGADKEAKNNVRGRSAHV